VAAKESVGVVESPGVCLPFEIQVDRPRRAVGDLPREGRLADLARPQQDDGRRTAQRSRKRNLLPTPSHPLKSTQDFQFACSLGPTVVRAWLAC